MDTTEPLNGYEVYAPPQAALADPAPAIQQTVFFPVGLAKFAVLSVCTCGFYVMYWFYQSWRQVPDRPNRRITALVAALFCPLTAYFLFKELERFSARSGGPRTVSAGPLAASYFLVNGIHGGPDPYWLIYLLAFLPLLPVVQLVNRLNAQQRPLADPNTRFSGANVVASAVGGMLLLLTVFGMIWGEPPG